MSFTSLISAVPFATDPTPKTVTLPKGQNRFTSPQQFSVSFKLYNFSGVTGKPTPVTINSISFDLYEQDALLTGTDDFIKRVTLDLSNEPFVLHPTNIKAGANVTFGIKDDLSLDYEKTKPIFDVAAPTQTPKYSFTVSASDLNKGFDPGLLGRTEGRTLEFDNNELFGVPLPFGSIRNIKVSIAKDTTPQNALLESWIGTTASKNVIISGLGKNTLYGSSGEDNLILGNDDKDIIYGNGVKNFLVGGAGDDSIYGTSGADTILGGDGNDTLYGNGGKDALNGGAGDDLIYGGSNADNILGGDGNDTIYGNGGGDLIDGGAGSDTIWLGGSAAVVLSPGDGYDTIKNFQLGATQFKVSSLSNLHFTDSSDGAQILQGSDLLAVVSWQSANIFSTNLNQIFVT